MSASIDRTLFSHAIIITGVCVGAWIFTVQPKIKELRTLETNIAANTPTDEALNFPSLDAAVQRMRVVKERIGAIQRSNALANDSSRLYGEIMDLATHHNVSVQNLQPGAKQAGTDPNIAINRIELTAEGTYEHVASFLEAIDGLEGFIRPTSLNVVPNKQSTTGTVIVRFGCEALSFMLPDALTAVGGEHNVQQ